MSLTTKLVSEGTGSLSDWLTGVLFQTGSGPESSVGGQGVPLSLRNRYCHSNGLLPLHFGDQH